jgi:hypothetical protein
MATFTKTAAISLLAWQDVAATSVVLGSAVDVGVSSAVGKVSASFFAKYGRRTGTANPAGGPNIRIEASGKTSGTDTWIPITILTPQLGATIASTTLNGAVAAGATSFVVTAATNIAVGDILFLSDTSAANYEIVRVKTVSGTTITPEEPVTNAHATGAIVTDQSETFLVTGVDISSITRVRAVDDNEVASTQAHSIEVTMTTADSFG